MTQSEIEAASTKLDDAVKELCALLDYHVELALSFPETGRIYYKFYHPVSCPDRVKQLPAPDDDDVPDAFKRLFEEGGTTDEPKPDRRD